VIERHENAYFNAAIVVSRGELLGRYRKTHLVAGESHFAPGSSYPTFDLCGIRFGINICYDTRFPDAAAAVAAQGARLPLVPAQNMMRRPAAERWKNLHNRIRADRVRETGMWLMSADVTGQRGSSHVGYGPTCVMDAHGEVVAQVPVMTTGMVFADIRS
jgi:predicted amidohydrolase